MKYAVCSHNMELAVGKVKERVTEAIIHYVHLYI